jgi:uncharacterized Tic20 family protein
MSPSEERQWALFSHLGILVFGFIPPLVIMLTKGNESGFVRHQAVEALNFSITLAIASVACVILIFVLVGLLLLPVLLVAHLVFPIMGAVAANRGEAYRYPVSLRLVH